MVDDALMLTLSYHPIQDDIFKYDLLFIPIHLPGHWTLAVMDMKTSTATYYDSYKAPSPECLHVIPDYFLKRLALFTLLLLPYLFRFL